MVKNSSSWQKIAMVQRHSNDMPRDIAVATSGIATFHYYLQRHQHRICAVNFPTCLWCSKREGTVQWPGGYKHHEKNSHFTGWWCQIANLKQTDFEELSLLSLILQLCLRQCLPKN